MASSSVEKQTTPTSSNQSQKINFPSTIIECESNGFLNTSNINNNNNNNNNKHNNNNNNDHNSSMNQYRPPSASMIVSTTSGK